MNKLTKRQKEIVDVSIKIIANRGIQNLTIKNIAAEIGISEAAIYRHFASKLAILMAILDLFEMTSDDVFRLIDSESSNLEQIECFILNRYRIFQENPNLSKVMFSEEVFQNDDALAEKMFSIMHKHKLNLGRCIERGQADNEIRTDILATDLFRIMIGSMRLIVTQWNLTGCSFDLGQEGMRLWQSIKKMIELNKAAE